MNNIMIDIETLDTKHTAMNANRNELYKSGIRIIYLFDRNSTHKDRKSFKLISRDDQHFDIVYKRIIEQKKFAEEQNPSGNYRIYSSINSRNLTKAIKQFKMLQLENDFTENIELYNRFYLDIWNRWISTISRDENKESKNFLFDCDTEEEINFCEQFFQEKDLILDRYNTNNGVHFVTKPFNFNEMKRDQGYMNFLFKDGLISTEHVFKEDNINFKPLKHVHQKQ